MLHFSESKQLSATAKLQTTPSADKCIIDDMVVSVPEPNRPYFVGGIRYVFIVNYFTPFIRIKAPATTSTRLV